MADWFAEARFGLFVHFGLYALPARHEWVRFREWMSDEDYQRYFDHFDPDLFDARAWARTAAGAGMRYVTITTKHHDGFCLWDSDLTDFKVTNTPYGRDLIGPLAEACRAEGLRTGFYHSLLDWHHPDFPTDGFHPMRLYAGHVARDSARDIGRYADYLHGQVRELLTRYGTVDYLFFDFSYPEIGEANGAKSAADWRSSELLALCRELQPDMLVNDRLGIPGDVLTPEERQPASALAGRWEACQTLDGESWGYLRDGKPQRDPASLVRTLVDAVSKDGNLLLNVGPNGRGEFPASSLSTLGEIGAWMRLHGRSIHGCGPSSLAPPPDCRFTRRGDRLYLHIFAWPYKSLRVPGLDGVRYAQLLNDASEIRMTEDDGTLVLELPVRPPDVAVPVIELFV